MKHFLVHQYQIFQDFKPFIKNKSNFQHYYDSQSHHQILQDYNLVIYYVLNIS